MNSLTGYILPTTALLVVSVFSGCSDAPPVASPTRSYTPAKPKDTTAPALKSDGNKSRIKSPESAFTDDKITLAFPKTLGDLVFVNHHSFPQPGLGYSIRYQGTDLMKVDIYVYDSGLSRVPTGHTDQLIITEIANAAAGIRFYEKRGLYLDVKKLAEGVYPEQSDDRSFAFQSSRYQYRQSARPAVTFTGLRVSETFICGFKDHFIKVRVTYPLPSRESSIAAREKRMKDLAALLKAAQHNHVPER